MQTVLLATSLALAAAGLVWDFRWQRLPNVLCVLLALSSLASVIILETPSAAVGNFIHAATALLVGMILFRLGMIGAGDAKFYAAAALGLPLARALPFLGWTSVAGLLLLLGMVALRLAGRDMGPRDAKGRVLLPYGVAIATGLWLTQLAHSPVLRL